MFFRVQKICTGLMAENVALEDQRVTSSRQTTDKWSPKKYQDSIGFDLLNQDSKMTAWTSWV